MKLTRVTAMVCLLALSAFPASAKRARLIEGSVDPLNGVKKMNIQFDYSLMTVTEDKVPDSLFIVKHTAELNEREARSGDSWARSWKADRARRYEIGFKNSFNKEPKFKIGAFPQEQYTMIFKTTNLEPGYNVGVSRKSARLSGEAWVVETANPSRVICKLSVIDAPGNAGFTDMDSGERIKMAYYIAANMLHDFFDKQLD